MLHAGVLLRQVLVARMPKQGETCEGAWFGIYVLEWVELFIMHGEELVSVFGEIGIK